MAWSGVTGERIGRLVLIEPVRIDGREWWRCRCDCGQTAVVRLSDLTRRRAVKSCGCLRREWLQSFGAHKRTHGQCRTPLYTIWSNIVQRCENPGNPAYQEYGGRGIYMCDRWRQSFEAFRDDMGPRPSKRHSVDRIDNNGPYSPENCRWATDAEQARNTRRFCGQCRAVLHPTPLHQMTAEELASESVRLAHQEQEARDRRAIIDAEYRRRSATEAA